MREQLAAMLTSLSARIGDGLEDGTYKTVPIQRQDERHVVHRSYLQLMEQMRGGDAICWVDDRFTTSIDNPTFRTVTTAEILGALVGYGRLTRERELGFRKRLRAARWKFLTVDADEMVGALRSATRDGTVTESDAVADLRRGVGEILKDRMRLQWPMEPSTEIRGEVPFLLGNGHAVTEALSRIWDDESWTIEDASAASSWLIEHLEIGLYPLPVIGAGDPRSDHLIGTHLGGLILAALQVRPGKVAHPRQVAYLEWVAGAVIRNALKIRPEFREPMEAMVEDFFVRAEDGGREEPLWLAIVGNILNAMPSDLRVPLVNREALRQGFGLPVHDMITLDEQQFDELVFFEAVTRANDVPAPIVNLQDESGTVRLVKEADGSRHLALAIAGATYRVDAWAWEVAHDDPAIRRAAIDKHARQLDLSDDERGALATRLGELPKTQRVSETTELEHTSLARWYVDFEESVANRRPFKAGDLMPEDISPAPKLLRLGDDIEEAAARLVAERGVAAALRRFGGLPIVPPSAIAVPIQAMDDQALEALYAEAEIETAPPWTLLFLAGILCARAGGTGSQSTRIRGWIDRALADRASLHWRLYLSLARFSVHEGASRKGWRDMNARQQLAFCWLHANQMAEIVIGGRVMIAPLIRILEEHRFVSPRQLVEPLFGYGVDRADPRRANEARLRTFAAAPALTVLANDEALREWAIPILAEQTINRAVDPPQVNIDLAEGGLARQDLLNSMFGIDWGGLFEAVHPGAGGLFGEGLEALVREVLRVEREETERPGSGWPFIRFASGDAPFPENLVAEARATASGPPEVASSDLKAKEALLNYTQLAAANGWHDQREPIEAALMALDPEDAGDEEHEQLRLIEIAICLAMLESDILKRTQLLGKHLTRLGAHPRLRPHVISAARLFARGLSGEQSRAFVDVLGELWTSF